MGRQHTAHAVHGRVLVPQYAERGAGSTAPVPTRHQTYQSAEEGFARVENSGQELTGLFVETGRAYYRAFAETDSVDLG